MAGQTDRKYKAGWLIGGLAMIAGFMTWGRAGGMRLDLNPDADAVAFIGGLILAAGAGAMLWAAFMGWWRNG